MDDIKLSDVSNEENEYDENKVNTNPNNASFTVETLLNSREDYDKCIEKYDQETLKRFCFLYVDNNIEKLTNKISPYIKKKVTWGTLYEKVFRKIFFPFSFKNGGQYVTLEEIYDRINLIIHGEINNKYRSGYINKEEKNSIPSIINYFSYNNLQMKKNEKKNDNDEKIDYMKNLFSNKKKKMKNFRKIHIQNKQIMNNTNEKNDKTENQNNTLIKINNKKSSDDLIKIENKIKKPNINYKRLSSFNLDHLQRVYDNLNRLDNKKTNSPIHEIRKKLIFKEKKLNKSQNSNSIINNENLNNSKNIQNSFSKNEDINISNSNKKNEEIIYNNNYNQKQMIVTERTNKTLDSIINKKKYLISKEDEKEIRNIPKREIIKKNIYKKVEKLAYKDELEYFNRANIKASLKDKIFCSITPMINFIGENNIPDRDTDLKKRGDNLLIFKQMADDIMNIIHN
jgi:hypothetical protein